MENEYFRLPIFSFYTHVTYFCPDKFKTSDLEEAKRHGFQEKGASSASFGHGDAFETFDFSVLTEIDNLSMRLEKKYGAFMLYYFSNHKCFMNHEVWYTSHDMEDGKLKPLVGMASDPYNYIDQGYDIYIFERAGYVMVLSALDWENYSDQFTGFRVKADEFYDAWNKMTYPEPYR